METVAKETGTSTLSIITSKASVWSQALVTSIVCISCFSAGGVLVWTSPCLPDLERTKYFGDLSLEEKSWIASAVTLGAVFSGATGFVIDRIGRKNSFFALSIPNLVGWLLIAFSPSVLVMSIGRFITGFSIGGFILVGNVYLAEISEQKIRGILLSATGVTLGAGMLLTYVLGTFFSWFVITMVDVVISAILLLSIRTIPESPVYLIHKGRKKKAGEALMRLRGATEFNQIEEELNQIHALECIAKSAYRTLRPGDVSHPLPKSGDSKTALRTLRPEKMQANALANPSSSVQNDNGNVESNLWKNLCRLGTLKSIGIVFVLMILQQFCGINAVIFYTSTIFSAAKTNLDGNVCAIIIGADIIFAMVLTSILIEKLGRRILLFISLTGLSLCLGILGAFFYVQWRNDGVTLVGTGWIPLTSLIFFMIFYNLGIGPLAWFLMGELLPTDIKGPTSAAATSFNWLLAFVVTKTFEHFTNLIGIYGCFWFFAAICVFGLVFCYKFVPETGKLSLDEIQRRYFNQDKVQNEGLRDGPN